MVYNSRKSGNSVFQDGRLKPGTYKIRNIVSKTFVDIKDDLRELCGRPSTVLEQGRDHWDIQPLGPGYTIRKAGNPPTAQPDQYCIMLNGGNGTVVSVSELPVAWRIEAVNDDKYRGFEYVRIYWGSTNGVWDLAQWGSARDWTKIKLEGNNNPEPCRIWELIPVEIENLPGHGPSPAAVPRGPSAPPYEENARNNCCACTHRTDEPSDDGYGTTVIEVVTTRRKYRLED